MRSETCRDTTSDPSVTIAQAVAVGDALNDLPMFATSGCGLSRFLCRPFGRHQPR
jgi:phosphoserine phosphatase